jgi:uncharacterized protein YcnI
LKPTFTLQGRSALRTACLLAAWATLTPSQAHVTLDTAVAPAGTPFKAAFRVGHGCEAGSATHTLVVRVPDGFAGAKPMPKAGWAIEVVRGPLAVPYESRGRKITEDVVEVTWRATSREAWVQDAWYDEFVLRGQTPAQAGPLWFKVRQVCDKGQWDWADVPASGTSTQGLKAPAALLDVQAAKAAEHVH